MRTSLTSFLAPAALCGVTLLAAVLPLHADDRPAPPSETLQERAARLRDEIPGLPHLVRSTPNIHLIRVEKIETPDPEPGSARPDHTTRPPEEVTAVVRKTLKGKSIKKLTLTVRQRPPDTATAGFLGGGLSNDPEKLHTTPVFYSPERFLSARNPMLGGPLFEKNKLYLVFMDTDREKLVGGPYGYQPVESGGSFWVETVRGLVANRNSKHAISMSYRDFITKHRSAFLMVADCLGTEVSLSEPLWGGSVSREDIDPMRIHPESAAECAGALDRKRGWLGLVEAEPWLYQVKPGYPNQSYVEIRDGMLDFSVLGLDIGFPDGGKISVTELAQRLGGQ